MCNIEQSYPFSHVVRFIFYNCIIMLFVVPKPSLCTNDQKTIPSVVLIHIRQYHVSVQVSKRLIYLSGGVHVYAVCLYLYNLCNVLCVIYCVNKKKILL